MKRIAIFDSGVGGISIMMKLMERIPSVSMDFVSDTQNFPYGTKNDSEVLGAVLSGVERYTRVATPELLVIACNTASTIVLPELRSVYRFPVVGVVPAVKPAANLTKNGKIALLATPATVRRPYTDQLIAEFANGVEVTRVGSSKLVELAEQKLRGQTITLGPAQADLEQIKNCGADTIVLGCTHFPLLKPELEERFGKEVALVDSGDAIANRCLQLLGVDSQDATVHRAFFTGSEVSGLETFLASLGISEIRSI